MTTRVIALTLLLLSVATVLFIACQSKEVTSAKVYIQQDNWDKAIEQLQQAVQLYPQDAEAHYFLGEGYATRGEWALMVQEFDNSLAVGPKFEPQIKSAREKYWVTNFNSGVNKVNASDIPGAIKQFKACLVIDPKRAEAYHNLGVTYIRADSMGQAIEAYQQLLEHQPNDSETIHALARLYFQQKEYQKVIDVEQKAQAINADDPESVANIAMAYDYLGEKEKAIAEYQNALAKNPTDKDLLFNLARLQYLNSEYDKAIELFQRVIAANPEDYDSNVNVGMSYLQMADGLRKKLVELDHNGQKVPEDEVAKMKSFYKSAIPFLEKATQLKPDEVNVWNNLGVAYVNAGDHEKGKIAFDKAEQLRK
jgi:tetratricopeptide (TPR) repeat protein